MAKTKISEFSSTPANNTDIDSINIAEGCAPSGINNAIRELMAQLKDFQAGTAGDSFNGPVGTTTAAAGAFTTLTASSTATLNTLASSGATLTGGTINGMAIGGTTAAAVSATTLTTSSTVTHNGGTANGVTYLNGSKVLTSGSALTFDGTNLGIEATSPAAKLHIGGNTASTQQAIFTTGVSDSDFKVVARNGVSGSTAVQGYIGLDYANGTWPLLAGMQFIRNSTSGELAFTAGATTSASEQMRLTSTGLGIGTSSPAAKLHVDNGSGCRLYVGLSNNIYEQAYDHIWQTLSGASTKMTLDSSGNLGIGGTQASSKLFVDNGAGTRLYIGLANNIYADAYEHIWRSPSAATERMRIDSTGNLGLGVTPSAWNTLTTMQIKNASFSGYGNHSYTMANVFYQTGWKYIASEHALQYYQNATNGQHQWNIAPSGTAGNAISFTQAMTLDASGNLLVGTTSTYGGPGRINVGFNQSTNFGLTFRNTSATATGVFVSFENSAGGGNGSISQTNSTTVAYNTSSDRRLKKDIAPAPQAGADIDAIQVVSHGWVSNDDTVKYGLIAQDLNTVAPQAVSAGDDGQEIERTWGVDYSKLVPMLIKEVQALRARVAALEAA